MTNGDKNIILCKFSKTVNPKQGVAMRFDMRLGAAGVIFSSRNRRVPIVTIQYCPEMQTRALIAESDGSFKVMAGKIAVSELRSVLSQLTGHSVDTIEIINVPTRPNDLLN